MDQVLDFFHRFGIDWPKFIATTVNFCIVLWLLHRFAYKPILAMLEERKKRVAESIANAERIKQELATAQEQRSKVVSEANAQAQRLIDEARKAAESVKERTVAEARQQAENEFRRAQQQVAVERERMLTEARREIVTLVIGTTSKVTGKILTPEDQQRLAEETAREITT
jgi:F-type H+-transporting ATPase subunit b